MTRRTSPASPVLILTTFEQDDYVFGALRAGASGFLLKRPRAEDLIATAQQPPDLTGHADLKALTPREREVLELIARGLSNREIGTALVVEKSTIRTHVKRVLMKLGLRDRVQAVIFAYEAGLNRPGGQRRQAR